MFGKMLLNAINIVGTSNIYNREKILQPKQEGKLQYKYFFSLFSKQYLVLIKTEGEGP